MEFTRSTDIPQLDQMRMGTAYRDDVRIRGFSVSLRPLTSLEMMESTNSVADELTRMPEAARNRIVEHSLFVKKILITASTTDAGTNDPHLTEYLLDRMTPEEQEFMFKQYVAMTDRCNPSLEEMKKEDLDELVLNLKKNPQSAIECSFLQLANAVRRLATSEG